MLSVMTTITALALHFDKVRKRYFLSTFYNKNDHFYQDRLGTNIGKTQKSAVFLQCTVPSSGSTCTSSELLATVMNLDEPAGSVCFEGERTCGSDCELASCTSSELLCFVSLTSGTCRAG